jgi:hypothetical protein
MDMLAEIRLAPLTHHAMPARLCGIDGDGCARLQRFELTVVCIRTNRLNDRGKLVPQDQRTPDHRITDPAGVVRMQITAADAARRDPQQGLTRPRRTRMADVLDSQVARSV